MVKNKKMKAILFMLLSSLSFAIMGSFVKLAGDVPTFEKAFFRNLISLMISIYLLNRIKQNPWGKKENRIYLIGRGVVGTLGMVAYFYGIDRLILADSGMLNKMNPFFVTIFAWIFLKNKISKTQIYSLFIALIGVAFIIKPSSNFIQSVPAVICFMSSIFAGGAYVFVSYLSDKENSYTIVFYFSLISTIITFPLLMMNPVMPNKIQFLFLILTGIASSIGQFCLTIAYKYAPAGEVSIYNYSNVIFSSVLGIILFSEKPGLLSLIGYIFIIFAGYLVYKIGNRRRQIK
ncbi:MAG: DMT family transporter [Clostridiaceae bacterium]